MAEIKKNINNQLEFTDNDVIGKNLNSLIDLPSHTGVLPTSGGGVGNSTGNVSALSLGKINDPTLYTVQDYINVLGTAGRITGGEIVDNGSETVNVSGGCGLIRDSAGHLAPLKFFDWSAVTNTAIPSGSVRHIGVEYNSGNPQVTFRTSDNFNYHSDFPLGVVINDSPLHIQFNGRSIEDTIGHAIKRFYKTEPIKRADRDGGLILGETGSRGITVSAGTIWDRTNEFTITAITSGAFDAYYRDASTGFIKNTLTQWPNMQYDDGTGTLATLATNKYAVLWFYLETDGDLIMMYGRNSYNTLALAETGSPPGTVPDRVALTSTLIGRLIFKKSDSTAAKIDSAFSTVFNFTAAAVHSNLGNLDFASAGHTGILPLANGAPEVSYLTNNFNKTDDTLTAVSSGSALSVTVASGSTYSFRAVLYVDADVTGGHKYAIDGTATAISIVYQINSRQIAINGSAGQAGATTVYTEIVGSIVVNAGGALNVKFAQNTTSGTSTVLAGSYFTVTLAQ